MSNNTVLTVMIPEATKKKFFKAVKSQGKTMAFVLRDLIEDWEILNRPYSSARKKKSS